MSVNLQKGQRVSLSKNREGLSKIMVGLGWDAAEVKKRGLFGFGGGSTHNIDCDASVILLKNGRLESNKDVVYFGNLKHASGAAPIPPALRRGRWQKPPWMPFCCQGAISASRRRSAKDAPA